MQTTSTRWSLRAAARARVAEIAGEIAQFTGEIEDLTTRLSRFRRSVHVLRSEAETLERLLSLYVDPALILPNEIVSEIFVHVLPVYPICPPLAGKSSPTQLTHICRQWREIALSTPSLWRAITIPFRGDGSWDLDIVQTWLRRSGSCPLSLHMAKPLESAIWSTPRVFEIIVPHRARWEYLSLCFRNWDNDLLEIVGPMPLLREMKFDASCGDWDTYPRTSLPTVFCEAPHLRSMTYVDYPFPLIGFPWSQLTSLSLNNITVAECTELLQQTVNLVHCKVSPLDVSGVYGTVVPDTRLPRLESLELVQNTYDVPPNVMEHLSTFIVPALLRLQVPKDEWSDHFLSSLSAFIAKAGCKLQELHIIGPPDHLSRRLGRYYRRKLAFIPWLFFNEISVNEEYGTNDDEDSEISDEE